MRYTFLSVEDVIFLHDELISKYAGVGGIRDKNLLLSTVDAAQNRFFYKPNTTKDELASIYMHRLIKNHPFIDGNKRTGVLCALTFLKINGYKFEVKDDSLLITMAVEVAKGTVSERELAQFFYLHII